MKNKIEHFLLSLLLIISVLLGLSFWLNTKFGFNIFLATHWENLAQLQAQHKSVNNTFYISIGVAIFVLALGLYIINNLHRKNNKERNIQDSKLPTIPTSLPIKEETKSPEVPIPITQINMVRPPRLNLPKNMAEIAAKQYEQKNMYTPQNKAPNNLQQTNIWDNTLKDIFEKLGWIVKTNPRISGFTPNLFAIGTNENLWIGAVDCDKEIMKKSISKLQEIFTDTLPDIPIHIFGFIIDTHNIIEQDDDILIFHDINELKDYMSDKTNNIEDPDEIDNFNAYSDYIDTIIQYIKNI